MEEWIEIEGATREEAIERACNALNTTRSYLNYEVVGGNGRKIRARKVEKGDEEEVAESKSDAGKEAQEILSISET